MDEMHPVTVEIDDGKQFDEDFYENIEAPKFVDLTAPDPRLIDDDRYWFCHRVGCDQKHEEEMDSEAIYQNFLLRVMAARSPSVRLRKALCGKTLSLNPKCPRTVPAKSSRSRVSRLEMISSIPQKPVENAKPKSRRNISKQITTPNAKTKQHSPVVAKALTTPRNNKKPINPNPGAFRSARNPKTETSLLRNDRVVAKALVFHSPKKTVKLKKSLELRASMKKLCAGMKKIEIANKANVLGNSHTPMRSDKSRKQFKGREIKSRVFDSLNCQNQKHEKLKSQKSSTKRAKGKEESKTDYDIVVDEKSSAPFAASTSNKDGTHDEHSNEDKSEASPSTTMNVGESDLGEEAKPSLAERKNPANTKSEVNEDEGVEEEDEGNDDKENASSALHENREPDTNRLGRRKELCRKEACKTTQMATKVIGKTLNGRADVCKVAPGAAKFAKPKTTNPKPFRLRTDERRILREANTEKKHVLSATETSIPLDCPSKNSQPRNQISCQGKVSKDLSRTPLRYNSAKCQKTRLGEASNIEEKPKRIKPQIKPSNSRFASEKERKAARTPRKQLMSDLTEPNFRT